MQLPMGLTFFLHGRFDALNTVTVLFCPLLVILIIVVALVVGGEHIGTLTRLTAHDYETTGRWESYLGLGMGSSHNRAVALFSSF